MSIDFRPDDPRVGWDSPLNLNAANGNAAKILQVLGLPDWMTEGEIEDFLTANMKVQIATIGPDGAPHLTTLFYVVEDGSFVKVREVSLTYDLGDIRGIGDFTLGLVGRNLFTFTDYTGLDPETGATGGNNQSGSGLINQVDAFGFPTLRTFTFSVSTRF